VNMLAGARTPRMGLEWSFRFLTLVTLVRFSCSRLSIFVCGLPPRWSVGRLQSVRAYAEALAHGLPQLRSAMHAIYCSSMWEAAGSREGPWWK
jgi:hypothetical protein